MKSVGELASGIWQGFFLAWPLTLTFIQGHQHSFINSHWMCLIRLYLGAKYEVCRWNSIQDMASSLVFSPFWGNIYIDLWPSVKVTGTWFIECALLGCTLVPSMKSVSEIASDIWPVLCFFPIVGKIWPWPLTLTKGQGHRHLGH